MNPLRPGRVPISSDIHPETQSPFFQGKPHRAYGASNRPAIFSHSVCGSILPRRCTRRQAQGNRNRGRSLPGYFGPTFRLRLVLPVPTVWLSPSRNFRSTQSEITAKRPPAIVIILAIYDRRAALSCSVVKEQ